MMKRFIYLITLSLFVFSISGCQCDHLTPEEKARIQKESQKLVEFIGQPLTEYVKMEAMGDDFSEQLYKNIDYNLNKDFYAYSISVDSKALDQAKKQLIAAHRLTEDTLHTKGSNIEVFRNGKKRLVINRATGKLFYKDDSLSYQGYEKGIPFTHPAFNDRKPILEAAQKTFDQYIPKELLSKTYYYRFVGHIMSEAAKDGEPKHTIDEFAVALNPTVNKMPIVGSGGKYSIHLQPDGTLTSLSFQFAKFEKIESAKGKLISKEEALKRLEKNVLQDKRSLNNYTIDRAEFGYAYQSANGPCKTLVPIISYILLPNEGVIDTPQIYQFPASDDPVLVKLYNDDIQSEIERKKEKTAHSTFNNHKSY